MFGWLRSKSPLVRLEADYARLLKESHELSTVDRKKSDAKAAEAAKVLAKLKEIEAEEAGGQG